MRSTRVSRLTAVALMLVVSACSDSPTGPGNSSVDLATALSQMSLSTYVPSTLGIGVTTPSFTAVTSTCSYDASAQSFTCPTVNQGGLTATRSFQLLSAAGTPQSAFDAASTSAIRTTSTVKGTTTLGSDAVTIDLNEVMTLSGLLTSTRVLDGTQQSHISGNFSGHAVDETATMTIAGLQLPPQRGPASYPKAGTITMAINLTTPGQPAYASTMTMAFNGTSKVSVTFTGDGFTEKCTLDLAVAGPGGLTCS